MGSTDQENRINTGFDPERLNLLMKLTGQINSNLDLNSLLSDIINAAKILMEGEASSLFILDEKEEELVLSIPTGPMTAELSGIRIKKSEGIGGWVVTNNETAIIEDVYSDDRFKGDFDIDQFKTRNLICVPLKNHNGEAIGALQAMNKINNRTFDDHDTTIFEALANQAAIAIENARLHEDQVQKKLMEQQLNLARAIQTGFWPKRKPEIPNYKIAGISKPATYVGGDYFDYIMNGNPNEWGFALGDVTGKGMPASLLMAGLRSVLRAHIENKHSVNQAITRTNKTIFDDTPADKFITLFYAMLDSETHTLQYVNAGHNTPYLVDFKKNTVTEMLGGGLMLGIMEEIEYEQFEISIEPGQQVVIFSDGVTEAENDKGEFFEEDKFEKWLLQHPSEEPQELIDKLLKDLEVYRNGAPQSDDITLIIIKREDS